MTMRPLAAAADPTTFEETKRSSTLAPTTALEELLAFLDDSLCNSVFVMVCGIGGKPLGAEVPWRIVFVFVDRWSATGEDVDCDGSVGISVVIDPLLLLLLIGGEGVEFSEEFDGSATVGVGVGKAGGSLAMEVELGVANRRAASKLEHEGKANFSLHNPFGSPQLSFTIIEAVHGTNQRLSPSNAAPLKLRGAGSADGQYVSTAASP